jgi:CCAAT/enhancer binding protein (C/EBP)
MGGPLPSLKSFATTPKYLSNKKEKHGGSKNGDDYRRRRERNNVAVRKSREKAKMRTRETEDRVKILARENERLQKKVELLQEELSVLRSLFSSVGVLPEHIHRELAKHLDNFQAQHAANNY